MIQVEMLNKAIKEGYIVPAFNFANFEILRGIIDACTETNSPVILQVSESAMNYFSDEILSGMIKGIKKIKLPISIHLDHGKDLDIVKRAIGLGFDSVMIDGSTLSFDENVRLTKSVVKYAHSKKVSVEGELGRLSLDDDDAKIAGVARFTDPMEAKRFVELTNVDSLAISIGTNHGINKYNGEPKIRYDILKEIEKQIPNTPIVLHGASLIEAKYVELINQNGGDIKQSIGNDNLLKNAHKTNIAKINMDSDFRLAYTAAAREYMSSKPSKYCPRTYGEAGIEMTKQCAIDRIVKVCKSNNKAKLSNEDEICLCTNECASGYNPNCKCTHRECRCTKKS